MKIAHYSLFVIAIAMINIVVAVRFITRLISGDIDPNKYSMLTMFLISGMDLYIGVFHFTASFHAQATFHFFFTPALWFFILYSVLDYRLLSFMWMKRNEHALIEMEGNGYQRALQIFNCKFMVMNFVMWVLISNFMDSQFAPVVYSLILLPQIVHQILRGFTIESDYSVT
jgi:hypothetical protein